jgi:hypothetical protein
MMILKKYAEENAQSPISKLLIPTAAFPQYGIPHALLLVVEADRTDPMKARISLINSLGSKSPTYHLFEKKLQTIAKEVFSSTMTTSVKNSVCHQQDGWSCGWHMLENIDLLSKVKNVQAFVKKDKFPIRTSENIRAIYHQNYQSYLDNATVNWNTKVSKKVRLATYEQLVSKGLVKIS